MSQQINWKRKVNEILSLFCMFCCLLPIIMEAVSHFKWSENVFILDINITFILSG